jgi:steroid 5-alpha reductase family enzyme
MTATERIESPRGHGLQASFAWVAAAYTLALVVAVAVWFAVRARGLVTIEGPLGSYAELALADLAATLVVFVFSFALRNSSVYDAYWTAAPPVFAAGLWAAELGGVVHGRAAVTLLVVGLWSARLTINWIRGWGGLDHEDFRYRDLQRKTGSAYWLVSLTGLHLFPTAVVLVTMLPFAAIFVPSDRGLGALDALGAAISFGGVVMQTVADEQLRAFTKARTDRDAICDRGLWRYSRHPNYFGEISFWSGLAVIALASGEAAWWSLLGVLAIAGLFFLASIPMMEARQARKAGWAAYAARTSRLVPWPPKA